VYVSRVFQPASAVKGMAASKDRGDEVFAKYMADVIRMRASQDADKDAEAQAPLRTEKERGTAGSKGGAEGGEGCGAAVHWAGDEVALLAFADYFETFVHLFRGDAAAVIPEEAAVPQQPSIGGTATTVRPDTAEGIGSLKEKGVGWWKAYRPATSMTNLDVSALAVAMKVTNVRERPSKPPPQVDQIFVGFIPPDRWYSLVPIEKRKDA